MMGIGFNFIRPFKKHSDDQRILWFSWCLHLFITIFEIEMGTIKDQEDDGSMYVGDIFVVNIYFILVGGFAFALHPDSLRHTIINALEEVVDFFRGQ